MAQNLTCYPPAIAGRSNARGEKEWTRALAPQALLSPKGDTSVTEAHLTFFKNGHLMMHCNCVF